MSIISNDGLVPLLVDFVLMIIVIVTVIISMKKGFIKSVLSLACVVVSFVAASALCVSVAEFCYDNVIQHIVTSVIEDKINSIADNVSSINVIQSAVDSFPDVIIDQADALGVDIKGFVKDISLMNLSTEDTAMMISEHVVRPAALILLKVVCYLLLYIVFRLISGILANIINRIFNVSVLKKLNRLMGAVLGLVKGIMIVIVVASLLNLYAAVIQNDGPVYQAIEFSSICGIIRDVNLVDLLQNNSK
ncbi:MAG: CvpA family protein [Clostridia bacterium]|nr:CvpA family protein [Clostridia bacterium]